MEALAQAAASLGHSWEHAAVVQYVTTGLTFGYLFTLVAVLVAYAMHKDR